MGATPGRAAGSGWASPRAGCGQGRRLVNLRLHRSSQELAQGVGEASGSDGGLGSVQPGGLLRLRRVPSPWLGLFCARHL